MNVLILATIACLLAPIKATPGGAHGGIVLSGPSGIVTSKGAIGPAALGLGGLGAHAGLAGAYVGGPAGPSAFLGGPVGPSAFIAGPAVSHASVLGAAAGFGGHGLGLGLGGLGGFSLYGGSGGLGGLGGLGGFGGHGGLGGLGGFGGFGGYRSGLGVAPGVAVTNGGGTVNVGPHGVTVKGPATVPATIAGPAGKVVANGLYGVPTHGHGW